MASQAGMHGELGRQGQAGTPLWRSRKAGWQAGRLFVAGRQTGRSRQLESGRRGRQGEAVRAILREAGKQKKQAGRQGDTDRHGEAGIQGEAVRARQARRETQGESGRSRKEGRGRHSKPRSQAVRARQADRLGEGGRQGEEV